MRSDFTRIISHHVLLVAGALVVAAAVGCGDARPKRVPVSGQVLIDGKPLTFGFIRLLPKDGRPATGTIGPDGRFALTTFEPGDGAPLGTHPVTIFALEQLSSTRQKWHAPKKYVDPRTSGLTATVDEPTDSLRIELGWEGGKPFIETVGQEE